MLNYILEVCWALLATLAFSIIFQVTGKRLILSTLAGGIGWIILSVALHHFQYSSVTSFLFSAMSITIYAEIVAKKMNTTVTTTLIPGLIPLVPGSGIFFTMDNFVQGNYSKAVDLGRETLFVTAAITIGIVLITSISQIIIRILKYKMILQKYQQHRKSHRYRK
ncbi:MAG TPA: threonine/serine exporter family protein [Fusobacterium sp.]|uniref:threonine/serine exporter family protein n=1 Tax=Fusobacterium sp. TaxID=68766 RepID=UPI002F4064D0